MFQRKAMWTIALLFCLSGAMSPTGAGEEERAWIEEAGRLVEAAASGRAEAPVFRREVKQSRELLREMVRNTDPDERQRYQDMILMVALLDAAAACHQGGHIVCPPDLMQQLRVQLARLRALPGVAPS